MYMQPVSALSPGPVLQLPPGLVHQPQPWTRMPCAVAVSEVPQYETLAQIPRKVPSYSSSSWPCFYFHVLLFRVCGGTVVENQKVAVAAAPGRGAELVVLGGACRPMHAAPRLLSAPPASHAVTAAPRTVTVCHHHTVTVTVAL